jgi:DNA-binding NarL/FixJ family response regulator
LVVESGVTGYLTRTCDRAEIEEAVLRVAEGETTYCHKVLDLLMGRQTAPGVNCDPAILSDREVEIIRLIASGLTTKEIANTLYRSSHTISTHRKNIMRKLNLRTSSELMVFAMNAGLVVNES